MRLSDLARVYDLIDSPIAYHRAFVAIAESVSGAVFLSQVCYWSRRTRREDGFFYKTAEEWTEETGIPLQTQRRIREKLREKGILVEKLIGVPATLYFKLDAEALIKHLSVLPSGQTESDQVVNHLVLPSGQTISETTLDYKETSAGVFITSDPSERPCNDCGAVGKHHCPGRQRKQKRKEWRSREPKREPIVHEPARLSLGEQNRLAALRAVQQVSKP